MGKTEVDLKDHTLMLATNNVGRIIVECEQCDDIVYLSEYGEDLALAAIVEVQTKHRAGEVTDVRRTPR